MGIEFLKKSLVPIPNYWILLNSLLGTQIIHFFYPLIGSKRSKMDSVSEQLNFENKNFDISLDMVMPHGYIHLLVFINFILIKKFKKKF